MCLIPGNCTVEWDGDRDIIIVPFSQDSLIQSSFKRFVNTSDVFRRMCLQLGYKLVWCACFLACGVLCRNLGFTLASFFRCPCQLYPMDCCRGNCADWVHVSVEDVMVWLAWVCSVNVIHHVVCVAPSTWGVTHFLFFHLTDEVIISGQLFSVSEFCYY